ncbi:uroplakin-2 [Mantella aurantiaca]
MQLLGLSVLLFISVAYGQDNVTTVVKESTGSLAANPFSTSVIIAFPSSCQYSSKTAILNVNSAIQNSSATFTIPQCRLKRDLVVISDAQSGNMETVNLGYQFTNLTANTQYTAYYVIDGQTLPSTTFTTKNGKDGSPSVVFARSGGMVVITVLLSIAMVLLIVGLIVVLVLGGKGKK